MGMEKKEIDFGKRFGMGGLRFPLLDPDDQMSIDYDTLNVMIDKFMAAGSSNGKRSPPIPNRLPK